MTQPRKTAGIALATGAAQGIGRAAAVGWLPTDSMSRFSIVG
jgi:hypothetical protein